MRRNGRAISGFLAALMFLTACTSRLHRAIRRGDVSRVSELLDHGANPNNYVHWYGKPLDLAAGHCNRDIISLLLNHGASTTDYSAESSLRTAVHLCDEDIVHLYLGEGIDANGSYYLGPTILTSAVERGDLQIISVLLDHGANPNKEGKYDRYVRPREAESYPLLLAVKLGRLDIVRLLVSRGANPSIRDSTGLTALSIAARGGYVEIESFLRSQGAI